MKTFKELNIGDYIYHTCKDLPNVCHVYRITEIIKFEDFVMFKTMWFGHYKNNSRCIQIPNECLNNTIIDDEKSRWDDFKYSTTFEHPNTGVGKYIYNKAHNNGDFEHCEYELIQENLIGKTITHSKQIYGPDSFDVEFIDTYEWDKNNKYVLYKACYENNDGPHFFRYANDFYNNFTRIA